MNKVIRIPIFTDTVHFVFFTLEAQNFILLSF